jgi:hypothetical protein
MKPRENQYFRDNQMYTISSSLLLASSASPYPMPYLQVLTQEPNEKLKAHDFLFRSTDGDYYLINDDFSQPVEPLTIESAKTWYKTLPYQRVSEDVAFGSMAS